MRDDLFGERLGARAVVEAAFSVELLARGAVSVLVAFARAVAASRTGLRFLRGVLDAEAIRNGRCNDPAARLLFLLGEEAVLVAVIAGVEDLEPSRSLRTRSLAMTSGGPF